MGTRTAEHNANIAAALRAKGRGKSPTKFCRRCQRTLPRSAFAVRTNGHSASYCMPCDRAYCNERQRKYIAANPEARERARATNRRVTLRRFHGISIEEYDRIFAAQNGVCAICERPAGHGTDSRRKNLDLDHCHATNVIRGLLCGHCNTALGMFKDDVAAMTRAIEYLRTSRWPDIVRTTTRKPR